MFAATKSFYTASKKKSEPSKLKATITGVGTSPGGQVDHAIIAYNGYVYVGSNNGLISVIDPATNTVVNSFTTTNTFARHGSFDIHPVTGDLYVGYNYSYGGAGTIAKINGTSSATGVVTTGGPDTILFNSTGQNIALLSNQSYNFHLLATSNWSGYLATGYVYSPYHAIRLGSKIYITGTGRSGITSQAAIAVHESNFDWTGVLIQPYPSSAYAYFTGRTLMPSPDQSKFYVSWGGGDLGVVTASNNNHAFISRPSGRLTNRGMAAQPATSPWNKRVYAASSTNSAGGGIEVIDTDTDTIINTIVVGDSSSSIGAMCVSPVNNYLYVCDTGKNQVYVIG